MADACQAFTAATREAAIRELDEAWEQRQARRTVRQASTGRGPVYTCWGCNRIVSSARAECRSCGYRNDPMTRRGRTIA